MADAKPITFTAGGTPAIPGHFPNLASDEEGTPADHVVNEELKTAGIHTSKLPFRLGGEVPTSIIGDFCGWEFTRAWRYWVCKGPGIPPDRATELHGGFGREVRVAGHCGCPSPREWYHGFAVGLYHVDTPAGLKALADTLREVDIP